MMTPSVPRRAPVPATSRLRATIAFVFLVVSGAIGFWIAISGARLSGGIPLLGDLWNQRLGRTLFGLSGILCWGLAVLAWRDMRRPHSRTRSDA